MCKHADCRTPREPQRRRKLKLAQLRTVQATSWPYRVATGSAASDEATADSEKYRPTEIWFSEVGILRQSGVGILGAFRRQLRGQLRRSAVTPLGPRTRGRRALVELKRGSDFPAGVPPSPRGSQG
jgi:hypothetical protein